MSFQGRPSAIRTLISASPQLLTFTHLNPIRYSIMASNNPKIICQCGTVSFHASAPVPEKIYICHCLECRKQSSSAFGCSAVFPAEGLWPLPDHIRSKLEVWTRPTDSGNTTECYFCKICGVRLFHRGILATGIPKRTLTVKAGCLENVSLEGARHIWTRSAIVPVPEDSDKTEPTK